MIRIDTSALKAALNTLKSYVTTKGTLSAILSSVLVEYSDSQGLRISATDLSQSACLDVECIADAPLGELAFCVEHKTLSSLINRLKGERVTLHYDSDALSIRCGRVAVELPTLNAQEFPELPQTDAVMSPLLIAPLLTALEAVSPFASTDEARPNLNSVLVEGREHGVARLVATDGYTIAVVDVDCGVDQPFRERLVPRDAVGALIKALKSAQRDGASSVEVLIGEGMIHLKSGLLRSSIRLLAEQYVPYEGVIPTEYKSVAVLDVRELADEVSTVASLDSDSLGRVRFTAEGDQLLIESDAEKGRVASAVTIEPVSGELPSLALSSTYAARALKSASMISERAELGANVSTSPIVLTPTSLGDKVVSARFVVVPLRS